MARILVIEDAADVATTFVDLLEDAGHTAIAVTTAYDAVLKVLVGQFDLVLLDIILQGPNGAVAALAMRHVGYVNPIIVVTGGLDDTNQRIWEIVGVAGRMLKPVKPTELMEEVAKHVSS